MKKLFLLLIPIFITITSFAQISDSVVEKLGMGRGVLFPNVYSSWDTLTLTYDSFNISTGQLNSKLIKYWNNGMWNDGLIHKYTYDSYHKILTDTFKTISTNWNLQFINTEYDRFLLFDSIILWNYNGLFENSLTEHTYTSNLETELTIKNWNGTSFSDSLKWTFVYDTLNRKKQSVSYKYSNPNWITLDSIFYQYDSLNKLKTSTNISYNSFCGSIDTNLIINNYYAPSGYLTKYTYNGVSCGGVYDTTSNVSYTYSQVTNIDSIKYHLKFDNQGCGCMHYPVITNGFKLFDIFGNTTYNYYSLVSDDNSNDYDYKEYDNYYRILLTGIKESIAEKSLNIYPNPFTLQTTISFSEEQKNTTVRITDLLGNEIKTINFWGRQLVIEKGEMQSGVYFVQTTDEKKNITNKKIIIQ